MLSCISSAVHFIDLNLNHSPQICVENFIPQRAPSGHLEKNPRLRRATISLSAGAQRARQARPLARCKRKALNHQSIFDQMPVNIVADLPIGQLCNSGTLKNYILFLHQTVLRNSSVKTQSKPIFCVLQQLSHPADPCNHPESSWTINRHHNT